MQLDALYSALHQPQPVTADSPVPEERGDIRHQSDEEVGDEREDAGQHEDEGQLDERAAEHVGRGAVRASRRLSDVDLTLLQEDGEGLERGEVEEGEGKGKEGGAVADALRVEAGAKEHRAKDNAHHDLEWPEDGEIRVEEDSVSTSCTAWH